MIMLGALEITWRSARPNWSQSHHACYPVVTAQHSSTARKALVTQPAQSNISSRVAANLVSYSKANTSAGSMTSPVAQYARQAACRAAFGSSNQADGVQPLVAQAPDKSSDVPRKVVGVDFGTSRIGLAFGDYGSCMVLRDILCTAASRKSEVAAQVLAVAVERGAQGLVIGIPVQPGGRLTDPDSDSPVGRKCRHFANTCALLANKHGIEVFLYDERGTSQAAMKALGYNWMNKINNTKQRVDRRVDAEAAAMLLRLYFGNPKLAVRVRLAGRQSKADAAGAAQSNRSTQADQGGTEQQGGA